MRLSTRLALLFFAFSFLPVAIVGYLVYALGSRAIQENAYAHLKATTVYKQFEFTRWIDNNTDKLALIAQRPLVREYAAVLVSSSPGETAYLAAYRALLYDHLRPNLQDGNYLSFSLIRPFDGKILLSTEADKEGKFRESEQYFLEGQQGPYVDQVRYFPSEEEIALHFSAPVLDDREQLAAVLVGHANLEVMNEIMAQGRELLRGEETYLVNPAFFFVTEPWLGPGEALRSTTRTDGIIDCLDGRNGARAYLDYRGESVLGAYRWMPEHRLCVVTESDQSVALAPVADLRDRTILLGLASASLSALLGYLVAGTISRPVSRLIAGVDQFGQGNLDFRIEKLSTNELGQLAAAFNQMAARLSESILQNNRLVHELKDWNQKLEARVEERTQELKAAQVATLNIMQDVERANDALTKAKVFTDQMINSIPGIFYVFDHSGRFVRWNDNFSAISQYSDEEIARMHPVDFFHGADRDLIAERILKVFEEGKADAEAAFTTKSGEGFPYYFTGLRMDIDESPILIGVGIDISQLKEVEAALIAKREELERSNQELERFAYVASHDLQEPLRMVASYLQLLEKRYADRLEGDALEFIRYAVDGANRMKTLINDLLAYSRVGTRGKPFAPTDCEVVLARVLEDLKVSIQETGARITHDPLPAVMADDRQMESLFQNLIGNAIKFRGKKKPRVQVGARRDGGLWVFSVRDNGIGIDPQYFERVFIIFQRLHTREEYSGTGIGLAISKRIVERHGGRIWIESQPGVGSTFYFTIPALGEES